MISASIYCHGFIDKLLHDVILPFWKNSTSAHPLFQLWVMRYARGGQHLKVRLHVPGEARAVIPALLNDAANTFFAALPPSSGIERDTAAYLPPIDPEDLPDGLRPDRTLIWTHYAYNPELIGAEALSAAIGFEAAFVRCLAASTEVTLAWLDDLGSAEITMKGRIALALQILLAATVGIPDVGSRARCLKFQRNWLLRVSPDREKAATLLEHKVSSLVSQQAALGPIAAGSPPRHGVLGTWCSAMRDLIQFCLDQFDQPALSELDEASENLFYSAISRIVHNALNPTAIGRSNEAYLCQLLESALTSVGYEKGIVKT